MSDGLAGVLAGGAGGDASGDAGADGAAAAGAAGDGGAGNVPPAPPSWMEGLPEDLRGHADLQRMTSIEALAKGYVETRSWAKGRIAIPGAEDEAGWRELGERLRPEKADDYQIAVPEGQSADLADKFKAFAHDIGLPPQWAKAVADFHNGAMMDQLSATKAQGEAEVRSLELELGPEAWNRRIEATQNMLTAVGVDIPDFAAALQQAAGAGKALKGLFALAERTGELGKVDPQAVAMRMGMMTPERAAQVVEQRMGDAAFMAQAEIPGTREYAEWNELALIQARGRR